MGAFEYTALDANGRTRKGVLEGDTARQIRQQLRDMALTPLSVDEVEQRSRKEGRPRLMARGLSATDLALVTRQMATLVRAGLPLEEVLQTVSRQAEKPRIKSLLLAVRSRVMEGHALADGMAEFPQAFPEMYRTTVAAGEQSGHLDKVLERLADYTESRQQMRQRVQLALFYPAILTLMALAVVTGLLTYVVPEVVRVFSNIGQDLPQLTRLLIAFSDFLVEHGLALLLGLAGLGLALRQLLQRPAPRRAMHRLLLRLPVIGRLARGLNTARFARTLSILAASGVPILDALRISAQVIGNLPMREAVEEAALRVREGANIHTALARSGLFPPMTLQLIASGESSGRLEEMLERAAQHQESEVETLIAAFLGLFEPLLILIMGGMVLFIVLAILLPIFDLNALVQ